ncbi:MAG TPA: glycosyltransferase [Chitinophagaceae bacterium]|nr:glycosyltransferase [Chitinophagaceae bacterium]
MAPPLFSVMIPSYNCLPYLEKTIESVLVQDLGAAKMQIEVVDDCSRDGDVKKLVETVGKGRVQFFQQPVNRGSLRNFETCLNRATGQYVHLLHGDDLVKPGFYNEIESLFSDFPSAGAAITNYNWINEDEEESKPTRSLKQERGLLENWLYRIASRQLIQPPAVVVKREVYEKLGSFFAVHYGEDWEMWIRIAANYPVAYSPICLATYRGGHSTNISSQAILSGQNIIDLRKVIHIAQAYLPVEKRAELKNQAYKNFSNSFAKSAYRLYTEKKATKAARQLAKGALQLHVNPRTLYWCTRYLLAQLQRKAPTSHT